jgi:VanZ family protein
MPREKIAAVFLIGYMALLWWVSAQPIPAGPDLPYSDKVAHFIAWGVLGALAHLWSGRPMLAVLIASVHGALVELNQAFLIVGRRGELLDFIADLVGALAFVWLVRRVGQRRGEAA